MDQLPPNALPSSARIASPSSTAPPRFTIDLSLPPEDRYAHVAPAFAAQTATLPALYDELLAGVLPGPVARMAKAASPLLLRRVASTEETAELRGISAASGVPLYLLVAFNVLLDLLMGCTSGGVRTRGGVLHFRALDWGMDALRHIVVELEFVRRAGGPVVARSVTYFGYVGVLTGVRPGLSISLNFRPRHDTSTAGKARAYAWHLLLVLLGVRPGVSSVLRGCLLPDEGDPADLDVTVERLRPQPSTAAYLIFSDGMQVVSMEKDNGCATVKRSTDFLVTLNHDVADEAKPKAKSKTENEPAMAATGMEDLVAGSLDRKKCALKLYHGARRRRRRAGLAPMPLEPEEVVGWMAGPWIVNDESHYGVVMDPARGDIVWLQRWREPLDYEDTLEQRTAAQAEWDDLAWERATAAQKHVLG